MARKKTAADFGKAPRLADRTSEAEKNHVPDQRHAPAGERVTGVMTDEPLVLARQRGCVLTEKKGQAQGRGIEQRWNERGSEYSPQVAELHCR